MAELKPLKKIHIEDRVLLQLQTNLFEFTKNLSDKIKEIEARLEAGGL
jgi:hypothetical protein